MEVGPQDPSAPREANGETLIWRKETGCLQGGPEEKER